MDVSLIQPEAGEADGVGVDQQGRWVNPIDLNVRGLATLMQAAVGGTGHRSIVLRTSVAARNTDWSSESRP